MVLKNKTQKLSPKELGMILKGMKFVETNSTKKGLVEDYYSTDRGYDEISFIIQEIPVECGSKGNYEYQSFKLGIGNGIGEILTLDFNSPLSYMDRKTLCKIIKQNLQVVNDMLDLGFSK
jgi:hypothetical protein